MGRCRMQVIRDAAAASLPEFLLAHVEPGAVVITDGWRSYPPACEDHYDHPARVRRPAGAAGPRAASPARIWSASLAKRWLLGTHQGGVKPAHLQAHLDEFAFRFNRRRSRSGGRLFYRLLEQAVQAPPRTYRSLVADSGTGPAQPPPPGRRQARSPAQPGRRTTPQPWRKSSDAIGDPPRSRHSDEGPVYIIT